MATKKEKIEETAQDTGKSEAQAAPEAAVEPKAVPDASPEQLVTQDENGLLALDELAQRHRTPTWQVGALMRFMDWESDRQATDEEYTAALRLLSGRPLGGGRL